MHPYIHPTKHLDRPEHNHNYTLTSQMHSHNTRHSHKHHQFVPNKSNRQDRVKTPATHTMDYTTERNTRTWLNTIPTELKTIKSLKTFKTKLKDYLLEQRSQTPT